MRTLVTIGGLYVGAFGFALITWTADLWAKSFDFPLEQKRAKGFLAFAATIAMAAFAILASVVMTSGTGPIVISLTTVLLLPPFALILWSLYNVDLRLVYFGAVLGLFGAVSAIPTLLVLEVGVVAGVAVFGVALVAEIPSRRFRRYSDTLSRACSCCGYKQRALHELAAMGRTGKEAIMKYLESPEGRNESRVQEEWRTFRPTTK